MALKSLLLSLGAAICGFIPNQAFVSGSPTSKGFDCDGVKYVYAFGDSYSFVQGTAGLANFRYDFDCTPCVITSGKTPETCSRLDVNRDGVKSDARSLRGLATRASACKP
ncbi:hypothetical protein EVG20_g2354 [Dentipellis fragilis]|uniref:SGNH hydrolase-type esterase domain-containing protein n=1 Tax=Dentipellis fragilis TaxID=205917 RepID=A0A4Y9Z8A7_9AGAM|nr:hypothetical protein EVG20_g2354 [Dentipellis fragilis]